MLPEQNGKEVNQISHKDRLLVNKNHHEVKRKHPAAENIHSDNIVVCSSNHSDHHK